MGVLDDKLMSFSQSYYREESKVNYEKYGKSFLRETQVYQYDTLQTVYDPLLKLPMLETSCKDRKEVAILAPYWAHFHPNFKDSRYVYESLKNVKEDFSWLLEFNKILEAHGVEQYFNTAGFTKEAYETLLKFVTLIVENGFFDEMDSIIDSHFLSEELNIALNRWIYLSREIPHNLPSRNLENIRLSFYVCWSLCFDGEFQRNPYFPVYLDFPETLSVVPEKDVKKYRLYYVACNTMQNPIQFQPDCYVKTGSSFTKINFSAQTLSPGKWQLLSFDVDLTNYSQVEEIYCHQTFYQSSFNSIAMLVMIPETAVFGATAYGADRFPFCRINQNGVMERYEYDMIGRLTHIYDKEGNLLQELEYSPFNP